MQVRQKIFVEEQGFPLEIEIDEQDQHCRHIIALLRQPHNQGDNQEVDTWIPIGNLRMFEYQPKVGKIGRVGVLKEYRGLSIGRRLMECAHRIAKVEMGWKTIRLHAQYDKADFYTRLGYLTPDPTQFIEDDFPHVAMIMDLDQIPS
ncbi:hypothetical protein IWQ62_003307 [Dispira parvispora]|uniref:N-acetyltransferase domain-containing protein n=1 Tax=Dispira parvispora TaxID=1520584 RepID=A0A9W8E763_9FUNG|nr:hypothetical protein IWQ62_003307 [Dispira parvispora]